jgi:DNA uptake protein ComE-like DNA-binding protein
VKIEGVEVLTTQFYFDEDRDLVAQDSVFNAGNQDMESVIMKPEDIVEETGQAIRLAHVDLVVATAAGGSSGSLALTPSQTEDPYYPVVDFSGYDNDLTLIGNQSLDVPEFTLLNLNTATSDEFMTIPGVGSRMVREFEEYRPYISILEFRREIGKYVDQNQVAAYEAYLYVPIDVNESDAETLKQLPGVDDTLAEELIAARPYESNEAFLDKLSEYISPVDAALASNYLEQ